jgi:4'-phosphopantetheinyl transferase
MNADNPQVDVWVVRLDELPGALLPAPTPEESARAARFVNESLARRYLRSHAALRAVLARYTAAPLDFASAEHGKPYLPAAPDLRFNLSHSHERALIGVAWRMEIGVDVERLRPMSDCLSLAERFFSPSEAAALAGVPPDQREHDFFRRWTRIEAVLKARGVGLYGIGQESAGEWSIAEIGAEVDAAGEYAAAVAVAQAAVRVTIRNFEGDR